MYVWKLLYFKITLKKFKNLSVCKYQNIKGYEILVLSLVQRNLRMFFYSPTNCHAGAFCWFLLNYILTKLLFLFLFVWKSIKILIQHQEYFFPSITIFSTFFKSIINVDLHSGKSSEASMSRHYSDDRTTSLWCFNGINREKVDFIFSKQFVIWC